MLIFCLSETIHELVTPPPLAAKEGQNFSQWTEKWAHVFSQKLSQIDQKILKENGIFPFLVNPDSNIKDFKVKIKKNICTHHSSQVFGRKIKRLTHSIENK